MTREQNRACKLSDAEIQEIKKRYEQGEGYTAMAKDYGVTIQAIYYWTRTREERAEMAKRTNERKKARSGKRIQSDHVEYRNYKKSITPNLAEYENASVKSYQREVLDYTEYKKKKNIREKERYTSDPAYRKKRQENFKKWRSKIDFAAYQRDLRARNYTWNKELKKYIRNPKTP